MCVIAYKPEGVAFPSEEILGNCWDANRDGAGYMYAYKGKVQIRKGFMDYGSLMDSLDSDRAKTGDSVPYVIHFRIQTQGGVRKDCCHPFPISRSMDRLRELRCEAELGVAHNGIIELTSYAHGSKVDYSDTMEFITEYLSLIAKGKDWHKDRDSVKLADRLCGGGRLAILGGDGHCELTGSWIEDGGVYYSNASYMGFGRLCKHTKDTGEEWENYRTPSGYDFFEDYCPLSVDGDFRYCEKCLSYPSCMSLEYSFEDEWLDKEDDERCI